MNDQTKELTVKNSTELALWQRLSRYGLDPADWMVRRLMEGFYCAIHRVESSYVLVGEAKATASCALKWDWQTLDLCELD